MDDDYDELQEHRAKFLLLEKLLHEAEGRVWSYDRSLDMICSRGCNWSECGEREDGNLIHSDIRDALGDVKELKEQMVESSALRSLVRSKYVKSIRFPFKDLRNALEKATNDVEELLAERDDALKEKKIEVLEAELDALKE
jgi:hypothetical protein